MERCVVLCSAADQLQGTNYLLSVFLDLYLSRLLIGPFSFFFFFFLFRILVVFPLQSGIHLDHGKPIQSHLNIHIMLEFDVLNFPNTFSVTHVTLRWFYASVLVPGKLNMLWHQKSVFSKFDWENANQDRLIPTPHLRVEIQSSPKVFGLTSLRTLFLFLPDSTSFWRRWGQIPLKLFVAPFQLSLRLEWCARLLLDLINKKV